MLLDDSTDTGNVGESWNGVYRLMLVPRLFSEA